MHTYILTYIHIYIHTYKTSLKADKELGGEGATHPQRNQAEGPRPRSNSAPPKQARNTNKPSGPPPKNTRWLTTISYHRSKLSLLELLIRTAPGCRRRRRTDKFLWRALATEGLSLSRAHAASLARTHAAQSKSKSISRFGGRLLSPPSSDIHACMHTYTHTHTYKHTYTYIHTYIHT